MNLLTSGDAARVANVSVDTIRAWNRAGKLPAIRTVGGVRLFNLDDVHRLIEARTQSSISK